MPNIRIMSLGEIVSQSMDKALNAFAKLINPGSPEAAQKALGAILASAETYKDLSDFKTGAISEAIFTERMITRIKEATAVELTVEQFDVAWNAMNPTFEQFSPVFREVLHENRDDQIIILISYTNPKDMKHLRQELDKAGVKYTLDEQSEFASIEGIPLYLSYTAKRDKAALISQVLQEVMPPPSATLFGSAPQSREDIKYVRSIRGKTDPIFAFLHAESHETVVTAAKEKGVATLFWDKQNGQPFREAIHAGAEVYELSPLKL